MNLLRRSIVLALGLAPLTALRAQTTPESGFDYTVLKPEQPVETKGKVEVIEFFWYGCPHCYALEPALESWVKKLPADAEFRRVPAVLSQGWVPHAQAYYAFEALGALPKLHRPFFDAIHRDRLNIGNQEAFNQFLEKNGVEPAKFLEAVKSFGVQSKVRRAAQVSTAYRIDGVPALAVQGRYTVSAEQGKTREGMLATADHLIGVARKSLSAAK